MSHLVIQSYGGGVQSVCLSVLAAAGALPRPDRIAIADTGREVQSTWYYMRDVMGPYLARHGMRIDVVPHSLATVDMYSTTGRLLIPAYTREEAGQDEAGEPIYRDGRMPGYCSEEWKRRPMYRWYRQQGATSVEEWIGFSSDEIRRAKPGPKQWVKRRFPLIEFGLSRDACEVIIRRAGLPTPKKSRCWMCPHQSDEEWSEVLSSPVERAKAVGLEADLVNINDAWFGKIYLHRSRTPLPLVVAGRADGSTDDARPCEGGSCWT